MSLGTQNPKASTEIPLRIIKELREVANYDTNIPKLIWFLYTSDEKFEIKVRKLHLQKHQNEYNP